MLIAPAYIAPPWLIPGVFSEERVRDALTLSLISASIVATMAILVSLPVAYHVARRGGIVSRLATPVSLLLLGLPPTGIGLGLLVAFKYTPLRIFDEAFRVLFNVKGIILAQFLIVTPLTLALLVNVFSYIPETIENLARAHGATRLKTFTSIVLPVASPGILGAWIVSFFKALGEFGATLVVGGNIPGYTETLPLAMYNKLSLAEVKGAAAIMTLEILVGLAVLVAYAWLHTVLLRKAQLLKAITG